MKRVRRLLASSVSLFVLTLGICVSISPGLAGAALAAECTVPTGGATCPLEGEDCGRCPESSPAPARSSCRTCDGSIQLLAGGERREVEAPARTAREAVTAEDTAPTLRNRSASRRLESIAESPPLHLLHATFRN